MIQRLTAAALLATAALRGQTAAGGAMAVGYTVPVTINVAPGQVITFFVHGIGASLTGPVRANSATWPTSLAGISVNFYEGITMPVALLSVEPILTCDNPGPGCGSYTAVTLQIPFPIIANNPVVPTGLPPPYARVDFLENGSVQSSVEVTPWADQIHLLRYCDLIFPVRNNCQPVVTHADGTPITAPPGDRDPGSPAMAGEHVVLYAVGLGPVGPPPATGAPFATGGKDGGLGVSFDARPNALASRPPAISDGGGVLIPVTPPEFAGPVAGFVGLYQINVQIPQQLPAGLPACKINGSSLATSIQSNLTINIGGVVSFDGAPICVEP